jgi:hypothetical protein
MLFSGKVIIFPEKNSRGFPMQPVEHKILSRIFGRGRGWAFTKLDFFAEFGERTISIKRFPVLLRRAKFAASVMGFMTYMSNSRLVFCRFFAFFFLKFDFWQSMRIIYGY